MSTTRVEVWGTWYEVEFDFCEADPDVGYMSDSVDIEVVSLLIGEGRKMQTIPLDMDIFGQVFISAAEEAVMESIQQGDEP